MPSADCLAAIADIATDPLQDAVLFVFSDFHQNSYYGHDNLKHAKDVDQPVSFISGVFPAEP
jgi:hypothetical protein